MYVSIECMYMSVKLVLETNMWQFTSAIYCITAEVRPSCNLLNKSIIISTSCYVVGGIIAHAFGPGPYTISGNIHMDTDEDWTLDIDPKKGINLLAVTIHQIGEAELF